MIDYKKIREDYARCYMDKSRIYLITKYFKTFSAMDGKSVPFQLFPRQRVFLQTLAESKNVVAIKPRQCGITTLSSAWVAAQCALASADSPETVLCIANKLEQAQEIIIKIRDFLEQVPRWFWGDEYFSVDSKSEKNTKSIFVKDAKGMLQLFNGCRIIARASGPNAARGISAVSVLILDEAAFIEDGMSVFATASATMASNPRAKTVMVSTPNGRDELYYTTFRQAISRENNFTAVQFRWYQDPRFNKWLVWKKKDPYTGEWLVDEDMVVGDDGAVKYDEERWARLERDGWKPDSPWYEDMCKSFNNDSMKIAQELDVSFMGSADNVVAAEYIEMQERLNVREPIDYKDPIVEETWYWKKPIEGHRYICACLPEGEKVLTQRGLVNVEEVKADDLLVTKEGEYTKIKHRMYRDVENEDVVDLKIYTVFDSIRFTSNHPIWSSIQSKAKRKYVKQQYVGYTFNHEFGFHDCGELKKDNWLEVPNIYRLNQLPLASLSQYWEKYHQESDNVECPLYDKEFWWYCGIWLAEGYVVHYEKNKNRVVTCHAYNEFDIQKRIVNMVQRLFNRKAGTLYCKHHETKMYFSHKGLREFLVDTFGQYAHGKNIAEWVKMIPDEFKLQLAKGYLDGDGWTNQKMHYAESVSKKLLLDFQDILWSLGISSTIKKGCEEMQKCRLLKKIVHKRPSYVLQIPQGYTNTFDDLLEGKEYNYNGIKKYAYFSDDLTKIYYRIKSVECYKYNGKVYNFETESPSHTFCSRAIATHNCDPSMGVSADRTAIEIIDLDGRDENGMPIIEQVMEYVGKKLGDDIATLIFNYATMYNEAYVVIDCTGGYGNSTILTLLNMGYKNLYYEDNSQKTYTVQNSTKNYDSYTDRLPGFHFQGTRSAVLYNFAGLVRNNEFKIRSSRVINELNTWIFKSETGRMDHMAGAHDDTICALAMALFVMQFSFLRVQSTINKDKTILNSYMMANNSRTIHNHVRDGQPITPKNGLPMYNGKRMNSKGKQIIGPFRWVFGGLK